MPAAAFTPYSNALLGITKKLFDLSADTFIMALIGNGYVPAPNTDALWSAVSANELATGGGYTAGGLVLAGQSDTLAAGTVTFTATSPTWPLFTAGPFRYGVVARRAAGVLAAGDLLLCYSDLSGGGTILGTGGSFTVTISASGLFQVTHTP